jgi:hypothetical protein
MARNKTFQQKVEEFEELRKLAHERVNTFTRFQLKKFLAAPYADRMEQSQRNIEAGLVPAKDGQ